MGGNVTSAPQELQAPAVAPTNGNLGQAKGPQMLAKAYLVNGAGATSPNQPLPPAQPWMSEGTQLLHPPGTPGQAKGPQNQPQAPQGWQGWQQPGLGGLGWMRNPQLMQFIQQQPWFQRSQQQFPWAQQNYPQPGATSTYPPQGQ